MLRGYLVYRDAVHGVRRMAVGDGLVVGRARDCGLAIDDGAASRRHFEVVRTGDGFFWRDLNSTNGTFLNDVAVAEGRLASGDVLRVGETELRFEIEDASSRTAPSSGDTHRFKRTVINAEGSGPSVPAADRSEEMLHAVCRLMSELASHYDPCRLLDRILETSMQAIQAQRAAVFLAGSQGDGMAPCPECGQVHMIEEGRLRHAGPGEIRVSRTVARRVLEGGESVLFRGAMDEDALNAAESIRALALRSIICVPLAGKAGVLGVLYIDSNRPGRTYTDEDMLLSAAVGNSAGLALENARMHREIVEKERVDQEIRHAWSIQQGFLVKSWPEDDPRFSVYGETRPARVVGGDFYDFVRLDASTVGIMVGDVSGKGVPAALAMAQLVAEFRLRVQSEDGPRRVLEALNRDLAERSEYGMFCTMHYLVIDLRDGTLRSANAGHHAAVVAGAGGVDLFGAASGPPLGVLTGASWREIEGRLRPGDTLTLFTDGVTEASAGEHAGPGRAAEFGVEGLCAAVAAAMGDHPRQLVESMGAAVRAYCAPHAPDDDCTLVALRYRG